MIEGLVAWVLNNYIGEYMELNTDQLTIALLHGQVDLENVVIRRDALRKFDVPMGVKAGVIGRLSLRIPITQIRSQPWVLKMQDFYLLLSRASATHDVAFVEQYNEQKKGWLMDEIENHHKRQILDAAGLKKDDVAEQSRWWGASFAATISNNIQIILENLHIRYEDEDEEGAPFNFGVQIRQLHVQTTNHLWRPEFVQPVDEQNVFKKIDFAGLTVYWNCSSRESASDAELSQPLLFKAFMQQQSAEKSQNNAQILHPFAAEARIEKNASKLPLRSIPAVPRFKVDIRSTKLELELSAEQARQIDDLFKRWALFDRARQHRKWRPNFSIRERPRLWWKFAIGRVREEVRGRSWTSLEEALTRAHHFTSYCEAYERRLRIYLDTKRAPAVAASGGGPGLQALLQEDAALIKQIERDTNFSLQDLQLFRDVVFRRVIRSISSAIGGGGGDDALQKKSATLEKCPSSPFITPTDEQQKFSFTTTTMESQPKGAGKSAVETMKTQNAAQTAAAQQAAQGGWFGWMTGWFYGATEPSAVGGAAEKGADVNEALYLNMRPPELPRHATTAEFREIERRMEAELVQLLNDTFDDSTILRRDNVLAELVLKVERVFARFSNNSNDGDQRHQEKGRRGTMTKPMAEKHPSGASSHCSKATGAAAESGAASTPSRLFTCDLRQLCARSQLSLKEHRAEVSLSVEDMAVQQLEIFPGGSTQKKPPGGGVLYPSMTTSPISPLSDADANSSSADDEGLDIFGVELDEEMMEEEEEESGAEESLLYGFRGGQATGVGGTQLLLTVGRAHDENEHHQQNSQRGSGRCRDFPRVGGKRPPKRRKKDSARSKLSAPKKPFLQLFYKRLAPKIEVLHEVNIETQPISVICAENALQSFLDLFSPQNDEEQAKSASMTSLAADDGGPGEQMASTIKDVQKQQQQTINQVFLTLNIPQLIVELRNRKAALGTILLPSVFSPGGGGTGTIETPSPMEAFPSGGHAGSPMASSSSPPFFVDPAPFARFHAHRLQLFLSNEKSNQLCRMNLSAGAFTVEDLFEAVQQTQEINVSNKETQQKPHLDQFYLLRTGPIVSGGENEGELNEPSSPLSTSCPDLSTLAPAERGAHQGRVGGGGYAHPGTFFYTPQKPFPIHSSNNPPAQNPPPTGAPTATPGSSCTGRLHQREQQGGEEFVIPKSLPNRQHPHFFSVSSGKGTPRGRAGDTPAHNQQLKPPFPNRASSTTRSGFFLPGAATGGSGSENGGGGGLTMEIVLVHHSHPKFTTVYGGKSCLVSGRLGEDTLVVVNRRTWALLIDFFGLLGPLPPPEEESRQKEPPLSCKLDVRLEFPLLRALMNYSAEGRALGELTVADCWLKFQIDLATLAAPLAMDVYTDEVRLSDLSGSDHSPTALYTNRLLVRRRSPASADWTERGRRGSSTSAAGPSFYLPHEGGGTTLGGDLGAAEEERRAETALLALKITKSRDPAECWLKAVIAVKADDVCFVHTQRFSLALLQFWLDFFDLQGRIQLQNSTLDALKRGVCPPLLLRSEKMRCDLSLEAGGNSEGMVRLLIPQSAHSREVMVFEGERLELETAWSRASELRTLLDKYQLENANESDGHDCLMELYTVAFFMVSARRAIFCCSPPTHPNKGNDLIYSLGDGEYIRSGPGWLVTTNEGAGGGGTNFHFKIGRNLSALFSHKVPDLFVIWKIRDTALHFSLDFWKLLRGAVDHNFAEQLPVADPETVPFELLLLPPDICDVSLTKYLTFAFRLVLNNIQVSFSEPPPTLLIPSSAEAIVSGGGSRVLRCHRDEIAAACSSQTPSPFVRLEVHRGRVQLNASVDGHIEFGLILPESSSTRLMASEDFTSKNSTTSSNDGSSSSVNLFTQLLCARSSTQPAASNETPPPSKDRKLMFETHIVLPRDAPPTVSLVLVNARVLLHLELLDRFKNFVLATSDFTPPAQKQKQNYGVQRQTRAPSTSTPQGPVVEAAAPERSRSSHNLLRISSSSTQQQQRRHPSPASVVFPPAAAAQPKPGPGTSATGGATTTLPFFQHPLQQPDSGAPFVYVRPMPDQFQQFLLSHPSPPPPLSPPEVFSETPPTATDKRAVSRSRTNDSPNSLLPHTQQQGDDETGVGGGVTLKVTLKECELVAVERPDLDQSFALVCRTTAVVVAGGVGARAASGATLNDPLDLLDAQLELQKVELFRCAMWDEPARWCALSEEFRATLSIQTDLLQQQPSGGGVPSSHQQKLSGETVRGGISSIVQEEALLFPRGRQLLTATLDAFDARLSLRDAVAVRETLSRTAERFTRYQEHLAELEKRRLNNPPVLTTTFYAGGTGSAVHRSASASSAAVGSAAFRIHFNCNNASVVLLDDTVSQDRTAQLFRLALRDVELGRKAAHIQAHFSLALDVYNRRLFGWEPLLDWWTVQRLELTSGAGRFTLNLDSAPEPPLDVNITENAIDLFRSLWTRWEGIVDSLELESVRRAFCSSSFPPPYTATTAQNRPSGGTFRAGAGGYFALGSFSPGVEFEARVKLSGVGLSLIGLDQEELVYFRLTHIFLNTQKHRDTCQVNCNIWNIQADNQLLAAERWPFLYCDPTVLRDEPLPGPIPALIFEMSYTPTQSFDAFDTFRVKLCNSCIMVEEHLLLKLLAFIQHVFGGDSSKNPSQTPSSSSHSQHSTTEKPPLQRSSEAMEMTPHGAGSPRQCYFGTLQLEIGNISLSANPTEKGVLGPELRALKERYSVSMVGFENALVQLPPFCHLHFFGLYEQLRSLLAQFFIGELQKQKLRIVWTMDALGNPQGFANDVKDSIQGLLFEGDIGGFAFGLSYGAANSISKMASSVATGLGKLTFDENHEQLRRRMIRTQSTVQYNSGATPLSHLYGGVKGLGVGIYGGLTAIVRNTVSATNEDGVTGLVRGVATGTIDTVMKPLQGVLDFVDGTASAVREAVGGDHLARRAHFPDQRLRLPRCCTSLSGLLPAHSEELAVAQQELLRITQWRTAGERLLALLPVLDFTRNGVHIVHRALIGSEQCYVLKQLDDQPPAVVQRLGYTHLRSIRPVDVAQTGRSPQLAGVVPVEMFYKNPGSGGGAANTSTSSAHHQQPSTSSASSSSAAGGGSQTVSVLCSDRRTAQRFCKKILAAKRHFDAAQTQRRQQQQASGGSKERGSAFHKRTLSTTLL